MSERLNNSGDKQNGQSWENMDVQAEQARLDKMMEEFRQELNDIEHGSAGREHKENAPGEEQLAEEAVDEVLENEQTDHSSNKQNGQSWENMDVQAEHEKQMALINERKKIKEKIKEVKEKQAKEIAEWQAREMEEAKGQEVETAQKKETETQQLSEAEEQKVKGILQNTQKELGENVRQIEAEEQLTKLMEELHQINQELNNIEHGSARREYKEDAPTEERPAEEVAVEEPGDKLMIEQKDQPEGSEDMDPLVAINIDWTHDKHELARELAEKAVNAESAEGKIIARLWKGTLFKKYYEKKYEKEFFKGDRKDENGKTVNDLLREQKPAVMERFILGATESMEYVHEKIGEQRKDGTYDGEKLEKVDEETNEKIKSVIEDYARRHLKAGEKVSDLDREFRDNMQRVIQEAIDAGRMTKGSKDSNYLEVAKKAAERYERIAVNARNKVEQDAAMAQVMLGFQAYNAEVRNDVRTDAHRDAIDTIVNKLESSALGQFIPAEIVAGALGITFGLTQSGARALGGAGVGILASTLISGLKERNRITEDRARMLRDAANGLEYSQEGDEEGLKGVAKKRAKYEQRIGGTLYDMQKASDLTQNIENALNPENNASNMDKLRAIAEARVRISFSDSEQKDLVSYTSAEERGKERLALDMAVIRAEKSLSDEDKKILEGLKKEIQRKIVEGYEDEEGNHHAGVEEQDKDFKNYRALAAVKKAGKTLALGATIFLGSQEIMAAVDPSKIGVFEKAGLLKTQNNIDAQETLLARLGGRGEYTIVNSSTVTARSSDPNEIAKYEAAGYSKTQTAPGWAETRKTLADIDPANSTARVNVKYDGWANNGTRLSDGNELATHIKDGSFISTMRGASTMNGQALNYDPSRMKGFLTIGGAKFEVVGKINNAGQLTWGENGIFTTTTGETIRAIGSNGEKAYKFFEVALDNGVDANGIQHIIPFATDIGANTFAGKMQQVVENVIEHPPEYLLTKTIENSQTFLRGLTTAGIGFAPETARVGLGRARRKEVEVSTPQPEETTEFQSPAVVGGQSSEFQPPAVINEQSTEIQPTVIEMPGPVYSENPDFQPPAVVGEQSTEAQPAVTGEPIPMPGPVAGETQPATVESEAPQFVEDPHINEPYRQRRLDGNLPEGVRDEQDYNEYVEEYRAREAEAQSATQAESSEAPSEAANESNETSGESENGAGATIRREIENNAGLLGGDQGIYFLTNTEGLTRLGRAAYDSWWSSLSDYGKAFVRRILNQINSSNDREDIKWGKSFRDWYAGGAE